MVNELEEMSANFGDSKLLRQAKAESKLAACPVASSAVGIRKRRSWLVDVAVPPVLSMWC